MALRYRVSLALVASVSALWLYYVPVPSDAEVQAVLEAAAR